MGPRRERRHALLPRDMGRPGGATRADDESGTSNVGNDQPFLPNVGEIWQVFTLVYSPSDKAAERPAVVVEVPVMPHGLIRIVTRTSDISVKGIAHPPDGIPELNLKGVFAGSDTVEQQLWTRQNVRFLGVLDEPYLTRVLERST